MKTLALVIALTAVSGQSSGKSVDGAWIAPDRATALLELGTRSPHDAVLVPPADAPAHSGPIQRAMEAGSVSPLPHTRQ